MLESLDVARLLMQARLGILKHLYAHRAGSIGVLTSAGANRSDGVKRKDGYTSRSYVLMQPAYQLSTALSIVGPNSSILTTKS
jgi:hypothetical protein